MNEKRGNVRERSEKEGEKDEAREDPHKRSGQYNRVVFCIRDRHVCIYIERDQMSKKVSK